MLAISALVALSIGAGPPSGSKGPLAPAPSEQDSAQETTEVRPWASLTAQLQSAGQEPRVLLRRSAFDEPLEFEYRFDQQLRLSAGVEGESLSNTTDYPLLGVHFRAASTDLAGNGVRYDLELLEAVHAEEPDMPAPVRRDMQDQIAALEGLRLSWDSDPLGGAKNSEVRLSGNLSRTDLALVLMDEFALDWCLAFPEEPVGVGAQWTCTGDLPVRMVGPDFRTTTTLTLTVESIEQGKATLAVEVQRKSGKHASADDYTSQGVGQMVVELASGTLLSTSMQRAVDAVVPVGDTGQTWNLHLEMVSLVILRDALPEESRTGARAVDEAR